MQNLLSSSLLSKNIDIKLYNTIIVPAVFYGCETWSVTLTEEHRQWEFEDRTLRKIFGPKMEEVVGKGRGLHKEEFHDLYCSPYIIWVMKSRMRWVGHVARMVERTGET